jgi:hypothetical protein
MIALILSSTVSSSPPSPAPVRAAFSADDREAVILMLRADIVEDERELLNRREDDLLAAGNEAAKVAGMLGMADSRANLRELLDRVADLLIKNPAVRHHDHGVEDLAGVIC